MVESPGDQSADRRRAVLSRPRRRIFPRLADRPVAHDLASASGRWAGLAGPGVLQALPTATGVFSLAKSMKKTKIIAWTIYPELIPNSSSTCLTLQAHE